MPIGLKGGCWPWSSRVVTGRHRRYVIVVVQKREVVDYDHLSVILRTRLPEQATHARRMSFNAPDDAVKGQSRSVLRAAFFLQTHDLPDRRPSHRS
jgi:hypothetical protein